MIEHFQVKCECPDYKVTLGSAQFEVCSSPAQCEPTDILC